MGGSLLKDSVASFFKIMIDHDFLSVLYLPPKFVHTTPDLLNKKTYLENLNGRRWNVVVSMENGSLAFRKGWSDFSVAHNLGIGDLVVFHYFLGQYFLVQVFNRSACDLRGSALGNGYPSKSSRSEINPADTNGSFQVTNKHSGSKHDSPGEGCSNDSGISASERGNVYNLENKNATEVHTLAVVPVENIIDRKAEPTNFEDPEVQLLIVGRDIFNEQRDDRTVIDLSDYEMPSADGESNKQLIGNVRTLPFTKTVVKCEVDPNMTKFANPEQELKCHVGFSESTNCEEVERSLVSDAKRKKYDAAAIGSPILTALSPKYESDVPISTPLKSVYGGEESEAPFQNGNAVIKIKKEVKTEPFEETGLALVTASASDLHCPIRNATSMFLELPGSLPLFTSRCGASNQKLVILRDPADRYWPVFYYHKPSMKILTTGWPAFLKANTIQSGDECIFKADTKDDATYDVTIVRKKDGLA